MTHPQPADSENRTSADHTDLLCIHGYAAGWHNWDPVVDGLRPHHRVHVARLAGHRDGPAFPDGVAPTAGALADQLERDLDDAGVDRLVTAWHPDDRPLREATGHGPEWP